jgi:hypothetical protein
MRALVQLATRMRMGHDERVRRRRGMLGSLFAMAAAVRVGACSSSAHSSTDGRPSTATTSIPDTTLTSRRPRDHVLVLEADGGASRADCARPGAIADTGLAGLCLHPGTVIVTGNDVTAAAPVDLLTGSWGVRLTLSAAA